MGVGQGRGANFCSDVLRIRWTGPKKINISVADLPGLFDAPGQGHTQQDLEQVKSITKAYLSRARTVIVMILDGEVDPTRNGISSLREQFDRDGERTIGVITKPDLMQEHPGRAAMYKKLLDNKWDEQPLTYGWVVVKNRDLVSQGLNSAQRDKAETEFLEQGTWKEISKEQKGVHQLRRRMARAFRELISDQLPVLAKEIHEAKEATQLQIKELPAAGGDMETKQNFLRACLEARRLTTAAVEGSYVDRLFDHPDSGTNASRLRDGIEDAVATLRERLRDEGRAFDVVGGPSDTSSSQGAVLQKEYKEILANTAQSIKKMGGRPGQFSEEMTINLFQELSSKWGDIVNEFLVDIKKKVTDFVAYALDAVLPEDVTERVEHQLFTPALKTLNDSFNSHVLQLLHKARVVTAAELNREVTSEIAAARFDVVLHAFEEITTTRSSGRSHRREGSAGDLEGLKQALPEDTLTYRMAAAEALRCAEKVYEVCRRPRGGPDERGADSNPDQEEQALAGARL